MTPVRAAPLDAVRAVIARAVLDPPDSVSARLGTITLRDHQRRAAARLAAIIARHGGALLAEPVGLGKTFSGLAVAARLGGEVLIAAPAALRGMWEQALLDCRMTATIITHEALSRGARPGGAPALVIVDESHRLRSPSARRYDAMAAVCQRARVLLMTATPLQNRRDDLAAQLALFVGRRAWLMSEEELARYVVRGDAVEPLELPRLSGPHARLLETRDDCLDAILSIPPPVAARDGSVAAALLVFGLVHQWSSSRAALVAALKRRRTRGVALASALASGRRPTRSELSAWTHGDDAVQLAFPELVAAPPAENDYPESSADLLGTITEHNEAIERVLGILRSTDDPDDERAAVLEDICAAHPGERVIAFCQYAETVNALRIRLARRAGVAALTAAGARIASGRVSRDTVLAQFTPPVADAQAPRSAERIDLLLTTDLLSEGLNLQQASVVVHLDLPWNPARLEQRVGRVRRLGSRFETVTAYTIAPPVSANRLLKLEERLREKIRLAQRTVGVTGLILPRLSLGLPAPDIGQGLAESHGALRRRLAAWRSDHHCELSRDGPTLVAAASAARAGFLALVQSTDGMQLVAGVGSAPERSPATVAEAAGMAEGPEATVAADSFRSVIGRLERWLSAEHAASIIDIKSATASRARRSALARVSQALSRAPRHRRALLAPLANAARAAAVAPLGEGAERILDMLVSSELPDEAWLRSIAAFGEMNARPTPVGDASSQPSILALIVFVPR